jgi:quinoprotein glucose dehydrogenase
MLISLTAILFAFIGIALGYGGVKLALSGGTFYYVLTAAGFLLTAAMLFARHIAALWLYAFIIIATFGWAFFETGFVWQTFGVREGILICLGLWLLLPPIRNELEHFTVRVYQPDAHANATKQRIETRVQ